MRTSKWLPVFAGWQKVGIYAIPQRQCWNAYAPIPLSWADWEPFCILCVLIPTIFLYYTNLIIFRGYYRDLALAAMETEGAVATIFASVATVAMRYSIRSVLKTIFDRGHSGVVCWYLFPMQFARPFWRYEFSRCFASPNIMQSWISSCLYAAKKFSGQTEVATNGSRIRATPQM